MANIEIKEGLKSALLRGETLKQAANSFINAGYDVAEVEAASKELEQSQSFFSPTQTSPQQLQGVASPSGTAKFPQQLPTKTTPQLPQGTTTSPQVIKKPAEVAVRSNIASPVQTPQGTTTSPQVIKKPAEVAVRSNIASPVQTQRVSNYEYSSSDDVGRKILIFGLIALLIVLLAGLGLIFFFQEQVSAFLSNLFS